MTCGEKGSGSEVVSSSLPIVAKFAIPVLLYYIVTLIVAANWETGPGGTSSSVTRESERQEDRLRERKERERD